MTIKSFKQYIKEYTPGDRVSKNVIDKTQWDKEDAEYFMSQGKSAPSKPIVTKKPLDTMPDQVVPGPRETIIPKTTPGPTQKKINTPVKPNTPMSE